MTKKGCSDHFYAVLSVVALLGAATIIFATKWGIGISPDSTAYISAARNLIKGAGLSIASGPDSTVPMTVFAPLYSLLLALLGWCGPDPFLGARWLNGLLFAVNIFVTGLCVRAVTRSCWAGFLAAVIFLTSLEMLGVHSMAWSEALFLAPALSGLILLGLYLDRSRRLGWLVVASLLIAMSLLTRYAGIVVMVTGAGAIVLFSETTLRQKMEQMLIYVGAQILVVGPWIARNWAVGDGSVGRTLGFYPVIFAPEYIQHVLFCLQHWVFPASIAGSLRGVIILVAILVIVFLSIRVLRNPPKAIVGASGEDGAGQHCKTVGWVLASFFFLYVGSWVFSVSFIDASLFPDQRLMSPAYVSGLLLLVIWGYNTMREAGILRFVAGRLVIAIFLLGFLTCGVLQAGEWAINTRNEGQGYASRAWVQSKIIQRIEILPAGAHVYSNMPDLVYVWTDKYAFGLPKKSDPITLAINDNLQNELASIAQIAKHRPSFLIWFYVSHKRWYLPSEEDLSRAFNLRRIEEKPEGAIYEIVG